MQLREYIEQVTQNQDNLSAKQRIEEGRKKLFDFEYPIFDSSYKGVFETNFIRNFYMREIGFETEGLFKFQLETWLLINMPYFNKLFESELINFDPLMNSKMESTYTKEKDTDSAINSNTNGNTTNTLNQTVDGTQTNDTFNRILENTTPDTRLAITSNDGSGVIEYASNIKEGTNKDSFVNNVTTDNSGTEITDVTGNTTSDITELETFVQTKEGKVGAQSYSKMLTEYRDSLIRVEKQIFNEMQQLFMLVY